MVATSFSFFPFCPFGFLYNFSMPIARPGGSATRVIIMLMISEGLFRLYLTRHGLKAQIVYLTIGIIGSVFITEL